MSQLLSEDEPIHQWSRLNEAELQTWAAQYVGWATNEMSDPDNLSWNLETRFPIAMFHSHSTDWHSYYLKEILENPHYDEGFATVDYHTPVVLSIEAEEVIIWDGWHRIACAIHRGDNEIMAIVGRSKKSISS